MVISLLFVWTRSATALSVSPSRSAFSFGSHPLNTWLSPDSSYLRNDAVVAESFVGSIGEFASGPNVWTLSGSSNGADQIRAQWSTASNTGPWNDITAFNTDFEIISDLSAGDSVQFYFRILTPTSSSSNGQYSAALTVTAHSAPPPDFLLSAAAFAVLAGSTVENAGASEIEGSIGVSPGSSITGIPPGQPTNGSVYPGGSVADDAQADLAIAYDSLSARPDDDDLSGQDLGGMTLFPGVYSFVAAAQLTDTLKLDAQGDQNALYIFQIGSALTTAENSVVLLIGGAQAGHIYWQIGSSATLGTTTQFTGSIVASESITLETGASVVGRLLARDGAVILDTNPITAP